MLMAKLLGYARNRDTIAVISDRAERTQQSSWLLRSRTSLDMLPLISKAPILYKELIAPANMTLEEAITEYGWRSNFTEYPTL
jgi:hypothetical protein